MNDLIDALHELRPGAMWQLAGDSYSCMEWLDASPKPTEEELAPALAAAAQKRAIAVYMAAIQTHLDAGARDRGYDSILSACSYASAPGPFQSEGVAYAAWRSAVWTHGYAVLDAVQAGGVAPTIEELLSGLPVLALP